MFTTHSQFYKPESTEQKPNEVVDVSNWSLGDLTPYSEGARDKALLESLEKTQHQFIIPNHKYLLKRTYAEKKSGTILYEQFWNEIIAYKLGRILQIPVPPAFVAIYSKDVQEPFYGSLIEWFYDYSKEKDISLRGGEIITKYIEGYDTVKGELHNFQTLESIFTDENVENWLEDITKILLFDALIGNTDRHQDNWQIVNYCSGSKKLLSPAFDNGTSLGYKIRKEHLETWLGRLPKMVKDGYHHMKWNKEDANQANHFELLQNLISKYPDAKKFINRVLSNDISPISREVEQLTKFEIADSKYRLSEERANFIVKFLEYRYNHAKKIFE